LQEWGRIDLGIYLSSFDERGALRCGPEGKGFLIQIPTQTLKIIVPVLKYGILFAKVALATQGFIEDKITGL
jgi:hypothetical protein